MDRYDHYLFTFHDEFVEAVALGVWFDQPDESKLLSRPEDHPLQELPESAVTARSTSFGIEWELRTNPRPIEELLPASELCSQRLLQYNLILDGYSRQHASIWLRTRRGRTISSFVTGFFGNDRVDADGIADETTFPGRWSSCVEVVANRRRDLGLA